MRAALSVSMVCCCWRESCSWRFCSPELWQTKLALWSFSCRESTWGRGRHRNLSAGLRNRMRDQMKFRDSLAVWKSLPFHSSSAAHSRSCSSPPPSAAGTSWAPLYTLTRMTAVHAPDVQRYQRWCIQLVMVGTDVFVKSKLHVICIKMCKP